MSMPTRYTEEFKAGLVRRVCAPGGPSAYQLAKETGVGASSLYEWVRKAQRRGMSTSSKPQRRPRDWSAAEKLAAVTKASGLSNEELGGYLRENGLHEEHLVEWRRQCKAALGPAVSPAVERRLKKENRRLNHELMRKDKALAETAALLVLSKKVRALWGGEGEDT